MDTPNYQLKPDTRLHSAQRPLGPLTPYHELAEISWDPAAKTGKLRLLRRNRIDDWFYGCHFLGDPVMPGCWGVDAIWEGLALFAARLGLGRCDKALAMEDVKFFGQIRPYDKEIAYDLEILSVEQSDDDFLLTARAEVSVDGMPVYTIGSAQVGSAYWEAPELKAPAAVKRPEAPPLLKTLSFEEFLARDHFSPAEVVAISLGTLVANPKAELGLLPAAPMLQIGRVDSIRAEGAGEGRIAATLPNDARDWFYPMSPAGKPAALSVDGLWQLMGLYLSWRGHPGTGRALGFEAVEVFDTVRPSDREVTYDVRVIKETRNEQTGDAFVRADADVFADGRLILRCRNASVGCHRGIRYSDYPLASDMSTGGKVKAR